MSAPDIPASSTLGAGADEAGDVSHATPEAAAAVLQLPSDAVGLELVRLLADSQSGDLPPDTGAVADAPAYDGHVALALDLDVLAEIDSTLDLLTSSHQLFDVPALDAASVPDDSLPT